MDQERPEIYERIPWETLEKGGGDRQWLVYAIAGAVVLGALAYSFMRNQPVDPPSAGATVTSIAPNSTLTTIPEVTPSTVTGPVVVTEADLYAVDPDQLAQRAAGHAEWFAVEYVAFDGSDGSADVLAALLPSGLPVPQAPEGTQVFVDWAGVQAVTQLDPVTFDVEVLVRSLVSGGDTGFVRQPPQVVTVEVMIGDDGEPRVTGAPTVAAAETTSPGEAALDPVPEGLVSKLEADHGDVIGGLVADDGSWQVVVMAEGVDGVRRPVTITP